MNNLKLSKLSNLKTCLTKVSKQHFQRINGDVVTSPDKVPISFKTSQNSTNENTVRIRLMI